MRMTQKTIHIILLTIFISNSAGGVSLSEVTSPGALNTYIERRMWDGGFIRCYYEEEVLRRAGRGKEYAENVLDAAKRAYEKLTEEMGFLGVGASRNSGKFTERDRTIEIVIGDAATPNFKTSYFIPRVCEGLQRTWDAVILIPNDPGKLHPRSKSSMSDDSLTMVLDGTLMHELTHVVTFQANGNIRGAKIGENWYVEGLARYEETDTMAVMFRNESPEALMLQVVCEKQGGGVITTKYFAAPKSASRIPGIKGKKKYLFVFNPSDYDEARYVLSTVNTSI